MYESIAVKLSKSQKEKLERAIENKTPTTISLGKDDIDAGDYVILATATQLKRMAKAKGEKGVRLKLSESQIKAMRKEGGSLAAIATALLPALAPAIGKLGERIIDTQFGKKGSALAPAGANYGGTINDIISLAGLLDGIAEPAEGGALPDIPMKLIGKKKA